MERWQKTYYQAVKDIHANMNPEYICPDISTPLKNVTIIRKQIEKFRFLKKVTFQDCTPLHVLLSLDSPCVATIQLLIRHGATLDEKSSLSIRRLLDTQKLTVQEGVELDRVGHFSIFEKTRFYVNF